MYSFRNNDQFKSLVEAKRDRQKNGIKIPPHVAEFFSEESMEVLLHFGFKAPHLLNEYSCALEDVLIDQARELKFKESNIHNLERQVIKLVAEINSLKKSASPEKQKKKVSRNPFRRLNKKKKK